tara:strand:+ start:2258 stop:2413 length:156 start_codon:yes stop_codon:yes gene_type:complete
MKIWFESSPIIHRLECKNRKKRKEKTKNISFFVVFEREAPNNQNLDKMMNE